MSAKAIKRLTTQINCDGRSLISVVKLNNSELISPVASQLIVELSEKSQLLKEH